MNDFLGHASGDRVLTTIADRIRTSIRPNDFAARLGGDEFVILVGDCGSEMEVAATAYRLLGVIGEPIDFAGQEVTHTASIGIVLSKPGCEERDRTARMGRRGPLCRQTSGTQPGGRVRRGSAGIGQRALTHGIDAARGHRG